MLNVAPLDYERYAVLVSPLEVPGIAAPRAVTPHREIEELAQTSSNLDRRASLAQNDLETRTDQRSGSQRHQADRETGHPSDSPHPTDFGLPAELFESARQTPRQFFEHDFRRATDLYENHRIQTAATTLVEG